MSGDAPAEAQESSPNYRTDPRKRDPWAEENHSPVGLWICICLSFGILQGGGAKVWALNMASGEFGSGDWVQKPWKGGKPSTTQPTAAHVAASPATTLAPNAQAGRPV